MKTIKLIMHWYHRYKVLNSFFIMSDLIDRIAFILHCTDYKCNAHYKVSKTGLISIRNVLTGSPRWPLSPLSPFCPGDPFSPLRPIPSSP